MPVKNGRKYIREAIDSVLLQSFKDFEFIIIDNGFFTEKGVFFSQAANYMQSLYNANVITSTQAVSSLAGGNSNIMAFLVVHNNNTNHDETHAVILESYNMQTGKYTYYDPTTDGHDTAHKDDFFRLMFDIPK